MCKFLPNHIYALAKTYTVSRLGRLCLGQNFHGKAERLHLCSNLINKKEVFPRIVGQRFSTTVPGFHVLGFPYSFTGKIVQCIRCSLYGISLNHDGDL